MQTDLVFAPHLNEAMYLPLAHSALHTAAARPDVLPSGQSSQILLFLCAARENLPAGQAMQYLPLELALTSGKKRNS